MVHLLGGGAMSIDVIYDLSEFLRIENGWNHFVKKFSKNPFLLSGFVQKFIELNQSQGWTPTIVVFSVNNAIVGISPLMTKTKFGIRFARFILTPAYSPDFVFNDEYQEACMAKTLHFFFHVLRCKVVYATMPGESSNLGKIEQGITGIQFFKMPTMGHRILPIQLNWTEFQKSRGKKFRQDSRRTERKLDSLGVWKIVHVERGEDELATIKKILNVETMSWKEQWRTRRGVKDDPILMAIWDGSRIVAKTDPAFKWRVWSLELGVQTMAYVFVLQYEKTAYIVKTSYDQRYGGLSPGIYLLNAAIRELVNEKNVQKTDFLTDLPFVETWTSLRLPRIGMVLSSKGVMAMIIGFAFAIRPSIRIAISPLRRILFVLGFIG
jgi:CelD/BcsL family acetyltransferase involved in cellulose biosynthesis